MLRTQSGKVGVSGRWHGWSVYIPVDGFFFGDREAIYRTEVEFKQNGRHISLAERLTQIYDISGKRLEHVPERTFDGKGYIEDGCDINIRFHERGGSIAGSMYIFFDRQADELYGILAVRPRKSSRPVAVKLLLTRSEARIPDLNEDMEIMRIRALI